MASRPSNAVLALLFVLGLVTVWTAVAISPDADPTLTYRAYEVEHDGDELVLTSVATGDERRAETTNVDDRVVCLPTATRDCSLANQEYDGEINATGVHSAFLYAYFDGDFYRLSNQHTDLEFTYEQTTPEEALAALAVRADRLTDVDRSAIEDGTVTTTGAAAYPERIVEHEDRYYTVQQTGFSRTSDAGALEWIVSYAVGGLGALGAVTGGIGLAGTLRSTLRDE